MWFTANIYTLQLIYYLISSIICNRERITIFKLDSISLSAFVTSFIVSEAGDRAVVRDTKYAQRTTVLRGGLRKNIGSRNESDFGQTYFGVCDVVGRHGLGNGLQGAPHASGHCRPASFTPASDPRPPPPTLCRRTLFSPHAWNKGRTATLSPWD